MISDYHIDRGPQGIVDACDLLVICSEEPTTYAEGNNEAGSAGFRVGSKAAPALSVVAGPVDGRALRVPLFTDGTIEDDDAVGTDQWIALLDTVNSRLIGTTPISNDMIVVDGNTFALTAFDFWIVRDPTLL